MNLDRLADLGEAEITPEKLIERGVIHDLKRGLKILGDGKLEKPLKVHAHRFSKQAKEKIAASGGQAVVI